MAALAQGIPNNEGAFRPIEVRAPVGSILNCTRPAPVSARHLIGHFVSQPLLTALSAVVPEQIIANGSAGLWNTMMDGMDERGREFAYVFFSAGGMGAAHDRDGLSATAFPSGIMGVPVEAIETAAPLLMHRRELWADSGGPGTYRGGLGQVMELEIITGVPANHSCMYDRTGNPAMGSAWRRSGGRSRRSAAFRWIASTSQEPLCLAARSTRPAQAAGRRWIRRAA